MHELSIAMSLLDLVEDESERRGGARVAAIHIRLGDLCGVVKHALLSAYDLAREGTPLAQCRLLIEEIPVTINCPHCKTHRPIISLQQVCCAVCGAATSDIVSGREMEVTALEIE